MGRLGPQSPIASRAHSKTKHIRAFHPNPGPIKLLLTPSGKVFLFTLREEHCRKHVYRYVDSKFERCRDQSWSHVRDCGMLRQGLGGGTPNKLLSARGCEVNNMSSCG